MQQRASQEHRARSTGPGGAAYRTIGGTAEQQDKRSFVLRAVGAMEPAESWRGLQAHR